MKKQQQERHFVNNLTFILLLFTCFSFYSGKAQETQVQINKGLEREIHKKVDKSFRFTWSGLFYSQPQPLSHRFFSIAFEIDSKGNYTDIIPSSHIDTLIFSGSIERMKRELPKDIFQGTGLRSTKVLFPVFVFVVPSDSDSLSYSPKTVEEISEMWRFGIANEAILRNVTIFPPILYVIPRGMPEYTTEYIDSLEREKKRKKELLKLPSTKRK